MNLEQIKQAIEVEEKHQFIDIKGKNKTFSKFIRGEIYAEYKADKHAPKWAILLESFERYPFETVYIRKRIVRQFLNAIKKDEEEKAAQIKVLKSKTDETEHKNPHETDVIYLKGVGQKFGYLLNKLGIYTVWDLLTYFPRRHIDYSDRTLISNLKPQTATTIFGYISGVQAYTTKRGLGIIKIRVKDESGSIDLSFFHAKANRVMLERLKSNFPKNAGIMVSGIGKINGFDKKLTLDKVQYTIISGDFAENKNLNLGRIVPIYALSENLNIKTLRKCVFNALTEYGETIENTTPAALRKKHKLLDKKAAIEQIHFPDSMEKLEQARFSLVFDEFYNFQVAVLKLRKENKKRLSMPLKIEPNGLVMKFIKSLPFELTSAQKRSINEILNDMVSEEPMQRLLQGDVGSGKTVVATAMLLAAAENGYQGAIMAPTEILALQHYHNLKNWLTPLGLSVGLFLGSNTLKSRKILETNLSNGQIDIAVGTHALIQEGIEFKSLGAIVIDEQHRFGVRQREKLKKKSKFPQTLTMTATPIPRTLALTVYGNLDLTTIDEMPKGRLPVKTALTSSRGGLYKLMKREVEAGHQVYVVYPLIDESETLSAKAATIEAQRLRDEIFPQYKVGLLHGKLKNDEKETVMRDFKNKKYDILVATTVVEVGVDVENATVMAIENAERFGLSQLHQLRGRVGRGMAQSYCVLLSDTRTPETRERLEVLTQTNDGFIVADKDLELRGQGDVLGTLQSGAPDFKIADLVRDTKILELARNEALEILRQKC